jgi:hypothetical protein
MFYESIVASTGGSPFHAGYAQLVGVASGGQTTVAAPSVGAGTEASTKDSFHFGIVSVDGTGPITIQGNGKLINGAASITLAASPGASAHLYYSNSLGQWLAFLGAGGAGELPLPTYTSRGPVAPQALTGVATAVGGVSITTAAFGPTQKAIVTVSVELDTVAGVQDNVTLSIFDGVPAGGIDTYHQTAGNSAVDVLGAFNTVSWTLEIVGNGLARTFGLAVSEVTPGNVTIPINGCRAVIQIVDG